ncbi:receptor-type tyrosine-protein phosphatase N2 isoform X2 [Octodon degus]|uniref:Receptor-type tyrosine-protein phosphatase N2 isoform X2 n=1 Tax=Octodon degus TaxID=10160 RepID=A0A6P6E867_OCTDE|nr:receptor-type tyrosine-protein phosphatase N2 isoform X2 [Octodon degus]
MGPPLRALLLLLPLALPAAPAPAPRGRQLQGRLGCLLEDGLCGSTEACINDGVFGRCQKVPALDASRYEVSPVALQHLRGTLQALSSTGFTWQDDHTQHIMAQELAGLPRAHPQRMETPGPARTSQQNADREGQYSPEDDVVLAKALQRYWPYLEALSHTAGLGVHRRREHEKPPAEEEAPFPENILAYMTRASSLTYPPTSQIQYPEAFPLQTLSRLQPDELSPKEDSSVDRQHLMAALGTYTARRPSVPAREGGPGPRHILHSPSRVPRPLSVLAAPQKWLLPLEALQEPLATGATAWEDNGPGSSEVSHPSVQLGDLRQDPGSPLLPGEPTLQQPFPTAMKKSEGPVVSLSSEEEGVGVENVKSQTYSKDLWEKPNAEPRATGLEGLRGQEPGAPQKVQRPPAGAWGPLDEGLQLEARPSEGEEPGYIVTGSDPLSPEKGKQLMANVAHLLQVPPSIFEDIEVLGPAVTFKVSANVQNVTTADVAKATADHKNQLEETSGLKILQSGTGSSSKLKLLPHGREQEDSIKFIVLTFLSMACIVGVLVASSLVYCLRHSSHHKLKKKLSGLGGGASADATAAYQELCRQRMAVRPPDRPEGAHASRISSVSSQFSDGPMPSPSARSSTSSWSEEPVQSNMDISTGHMILAYMEDHLQNKNRLEKEWEALCAYQAEPSSSLAAQREENLAKNRCPAVLTYDHSRILLKAEHSHGNSDYINASPIMDHDPRNPAYITTQGPLPATVADFWQMVWESGCAVIVMLTPLAENGVWQCHRYWPDEGASLYHIYEVNLVSEHIWCEDFLVRSFYLKNLQTHETRTVTQFHFLSWYDQGVPCSTRSLLDFRRKVNKCYRGRSCPIIVHCSDGAGRSGTYILIDMVLNKMAKGAKEIDIAATLEHLRDQRPGMVQTKEQFEFALTAVAEEVNAILRTLPQ